MSLISNPIVTGFGGTILGAGIGFIGTWLNNRLNAKRLAAANLRAAFAPIFFRVRSQELSSFIEIQKATLPVLDSQIIEMSRFRFYVCDSDVAMYDAACKDYYHYIKSHAPVHAVAVQGKVPRNLSYDEMYLAVVSSFLKFAK